MAEEEKGGRRAERGSQVERGTAAGRANRAARKSRGIQKMGISPNVAIGAIILLCLLVAGGCYLWAQYVPNGKQMDWFAYHEGYDADRPVVIVGDALQGAEIVPLVRDEVLYLPVGFVREAIDPTLFWDGQANRLTVTTPTRLIQMRTDELTYYVNNEALSLPLSALQVDGEAYMPAGLLMDLYQVDIVLHTETGMATVDDATVSRQMGETKRKTAVRFEPDIKSPVLCNVEKDAPLVLYAEADGWRLVRTEDGLLGYVSVKAIEETGVQEGVSAPKSEPLPSQTLADGGKINLLWDQLDNMTASSNAARRVAHKGLDVISPTWFSFDLEAMNGDLVSLADQGYVNWAHENGLQVWALFSDNFDSRVARDILSNTDMREHVIRQILALVATYRLDGINIDFENVRLADVAYYHQFLRELAPMLREQDVTLSVDMYVPKPYSMYYNRAEVARVADYVIIFGYDEYTSSSEMAGPVASIGFVHEGIVDTLAEVDAAQLILGVPYYTRVWTETETAEGMELTSRAVGMDYARKIFEEQNATFSWDEEMGCYYSEFTITENDVTARSRVWLEDLRSMEEKLKLVQEYDLAGVAGWRKGLESEGVWDLLYTYLKE